MGSQTGSREEARRSLWEQASQVERNGAGRRSDDQSPRPTTGQEHGGNKAANLNLRWTESSDLIAAVLGCNYTTHY